MAGDFGYIEVPLDKVPAEYAMQQERWKQRMTEQVVNQGRAAERRQDRAIKKAALATLVADNDLQFVYIRDFDFSTVIYYGDNAVVNPKGGTVVAYKVPRGGGNIVEVATSICHKNDIFDKLEGKFMAANNFASGKRIKVKLAESTRWGQQLVRMFDI